GRPHPRDAPALVSDAAPGPRVAIVAEFYPSRRDPVMGIWAHRQALAVRDAGAEVQVIVLHRVVPPRAAFAGGVRRAGVTFTEMLTEPRHQLRDGLPVTYAPYVSPPRERGYPGWGAWAAPSLALALRKLRRSFSYELIHAHNAVPAGDAVRRASPRTPLIVSEHGADVLYTAWRGPRGARAVARGLGAAQLVLANSRGIAELARARGAGRTQVVHLGAELPPAGGAAEHAPHHASAARVRPSRPTLVTVAHLVARKRHADVLRALAVLRPRHPTLRYSIVGDGPERHALEVLAARLGVADRVDFYGQLEPASALAQARGASVFVMPSTEEAFGTAYIEAMAAGVPAIGCRGEPGPEEIAAAGGGFLLVPPGDIERLSQRIDELLSDAHRLREASERARATVREGFTWENCGRQTLAAYLEVLARAHSGEDARS
ncbi:MAG TPA: glycosyltransferase, partial [Solirubrobacteraceae bacterium]|nr:glycosyltransferase [Solirubrobacteraceae bacterium]